MWKRHYRDETKKIEVNSSKGVQDAKKRKPEEKEDQSDTKKLCEVGYVLREGTNSRLAGVGTYQPCQRL